MSECMACNVAISALEKFGALCTDCAKMFHAYGFSPEVTARLLLSVSDEELCEHGSRLDALAVRLGG